MCKFLKPIKLSVGRLSQSVNATDQLLSSAEALPPGDVVLNMVAGGARSYGGSRAHLAEWLDSWFCPQHSRLLGSGYLTSQNLSFFIREMRLMVSTSKGSCKDLMR